MIIGTATWKVQTGNYKGLTSIPSLVHLMSDPLMTLGCSGAGLVFPRITKERVVRSAPCLHWSSLCLLVRFPPVISPLRPLASACLPHSPPTGDIESLRGSGHYIVFQSPVAESVCGVRTLTMAFPHTAAQLRKRHENPRTS